MNDLGDMIAYETGKFLIKAILVVAIVAGVIGFVMGKFL